MNPFDATHVAGPVSERRSRLDVDDPSAWHTAITSGPDLLVQHARPIVGELVGSGRMGLGTLLAPADPMVIVDGVGYRLDAGASVCRVSPLERVRRAAVVDFRRGRRFRIEYPVRRANVARLAAQVFGSLPQIVAVEPSGTFSGVTVPNGVSAAPTAAQSDSSRNGGRRVPAGLYDAAALAAAFESKGPTAVEALEHYEVQRLGPAQAHVEHSEAASAHYLSRHGRYR